MLMIKYSLTCFIAGKEITQ